MTRARPPASAGRPGLVVAGRRGARAALVVVAGRAVGERGAGEVGHVLLLPRPARGRPGRRRLDDDVVQPSVPLGRHAARLDLAVVDHPALLAPTAEAARAGAVAVVAIAELVAADRRAAQPGVE